MKETAKNKKLFSQLFLSYVVILVIPILLASLMLVESRSQMLTQKTEEYQVQLGYSANLITTQLDSINLLSESINFDEEVTRFMNEPDKSYFNLSSSLYDWKTALSKYSLLNSNVQFVGVYSSISNVLMSNNSAVPLNEVFYNLMLNFTNMSMDEFLTMFKTVNFNGFHRFENGTLCYLQTNKNRVSRSLIIIRVNLEILKNLMQQGSFGNEGFMKLYDQNDELIVQSMESTSGFKERDYILQECDLENGWHLVSYIKKAEINESAVALMKQLIIILILVILAGLSVALILTRNNSRPLRRIVASLSSQVPKEYIENRNSFLFIENSIANLIEKNKDFTSLNLEQKNLLSYELLRRLLLGDFTDDNQIEQMIKRSDLNLKAYSFGVISILFDEGVNMGNKYQTISETLANERCKLFQIKDELVIVFFLDKNMNDDEWKLYSHRISETLFGLIGNIFHVYISAVHPDLNQIYIARDEALTLSLSMSPESPREMHFESIAPSLSDMFYFYPPDVEILLLKLIKDGNITQTENLLYEIKNENFMKRKLTVFMTKHLTFDLRGTIIRGLYGFTSDDQINKALHDCCNVDRFDELCDFIVNISRLFKQSKNLQANRMNQELENTIYQSMLEHYQDPNFTISMLSEILHMSERTLYSFIKDNLNSSFAKMLEALRITNACAMIRKDVFTIQEIASCVGYTNDHTFRQAFKRIMHVTPSEFINALQKMGENSNIQNSSD